MDLLDWIILYVCAGIGWAEGLRWNKRAWKEEWPLRAWFLSFIVWPIWIVVWFIFYFRGKTT